VHLDGDLAPGTFLDAEIVAAHPHHLDGVLVRIEEPTAVG
jgi:hypothetical protein